MRHTEHAQVVTYPCFAQRLSNSHSAHILTRMDMNGINRAVGAEIRAARARRDWSRDELSERAGVPKGTLRRYEDGTRSIPVGTLVQLAAVLNLTMVDIDRAIARAEELAADAGPPGADEPAAARTRRKLQRQPSEKRQD